MARKTLDQLLRRIVPVTDDVTYRRQAVLRLVTEAIQADRADSSFSEEVVAQVTDAWTNPGIRPDIHERAKEWVKDHWFTLYEALNKLSGEGFPWAWVDEPAAAEASTPSTPEEGMLKRAGEIIEELYTLKGIMRELREEMSYTAERGGRPWVDHPLWVAARDKARKLSLELKALGK